MQLVARTVRYMASRYLADAHQSIQEIARANAAEASASLRKRRQELENVEAYLRERCRAYRGADGTGTSQGGREVEHAG
jgi:hypothetical protein